MCFKTLDTHGIVTCVQINIFLNVFQTEAALLHYCLQCHIHLIEATLSRKKA